MRTLAIQGVLTFLATALAAASSSQAAATGTAPRPSTSPATSPASTRTGRFCLMALGSNKLPDLEALDHRYDLMICSGDVKPDVIDGFRKRNPGGEVFCYVNTSDADADSARWPEYRKLWEDVSAHEDWFHHDANGDRVKIYFPKYKGRCAFNTGNVEFQKYLAGRVVDTLNTGRYGGIQLDNVSTEFPFKKEIVGKWCSSQPVRLTPAQWTADEVAMLKTVMEAVADAGFSDKSGKNAKTIIFNHMRSGEPDESAAYLEVADGANCESWMSLRTELDGRWGWKAKVDQVRAANRKGKLTNLLCTPAALSEDEALFCFASYLMAKEGDRAYFYYGTAYRMAAQKAWYAFYEADIGKPKGDYEERDGGFWRTFSKGGVVVNPTNKSVTVSMPGRYRTLDGREVDKITLAPKRGAILLAPVAKP
ncbi:MAG: putative glycoside hydrolase [Phycisphaerae bacterium]